MEPDADGLFHICTPTPSVNPDGSEQAFRPEWRTEAVVGLARGIVEDRAYERMPILADALEEAGCDSMSVLSHCRDPIAHEDGCWVLERILRRRPAPTPAEAEALFREFLRQFGTWPRRPEPPPGRPNAFRRRAGRALLRLAVYGSAVALVTAIVLLWVRLLLGT
jgi:hypothetical protein